MPKDTLDTCRDTKRDPATTQAEMAGKAKAEQGYDYSRRNLQNYIGYDVHDRNDEKIGTLEGLWTDHNGSPAFIGVRTGWVFGKTHVVPANQAHVSEGRQVIRIPYTSDQVKSAVTFDPDAELTEDNEREVYRHYGINESSWWRNQGAERRPTPEQATIQLSEEKLKVGKREVEVGGVRLRKVIRTETVQQPVELKREELIVERVPGSEAHAGRQQAFKEQEVYIPLRREEAVIGKEQVLREEVRVRKSAQTEQQQVSESVRKEDVEIEETGEASRMHASAGTPANRLREQEEKPRSQRRRNG